MLGTSFTRRAARGSGVLRSTGAAPRRCCEPPGSEADCNSPSPARCYSTASTSRPPPGPATWNCGSATYRPLAYGIRLERMARALDLCSSPLQCWVSEPIDWSRWRPQQPGELPTTRFRRIAVVEGAPDCQPGDLLPWPPPLPLACWAATTRPSMCCCMLPICWRPIAPPFVMYRNCSS